MSSRQSLINGTILALCLCCDFVAAQGTQSSIPRKSTAPAGGGIPARPATNTVPRTEREEVDNAAPQERPARNAGAAGNGNVGPRAVGNAAPKQGPLQPQPPAQVQFQPVLDPKVLELLQEWEAKTKGIETLECDIKRFEIDKVFATETRSLGRVQYQQPDHGRLDFGPASKAWMATPGRMTPENKPYKVVAGDATTWICTGENVYALRSKDKTYDLIDIPPAMRGQNITRSPLPFIFGMKAKEAIQKYSIRIGSMHNPDGSRQDANGKPLPVRVHVVAYPLDPNIAREFVQAEFLLDPNTFLPLNLRTVDPSGNKETVYFFDHTTMSVNKGFGLLAKPFAKPNLAGWQLMHHVKDEPEAQEPPRNAARPVPAQR